MKRLIVCVLMGLICLVSVAAQDSTRYFWETVGLYVAVPQGWANPVPLEQNGAPVLLLKPVLTGAATVDGITVQFKRLPAQENAVDSSALLKTEFDALTLRLAVTQTIQWLDGSGLEGFGTDKDDLLYGRGRIIVQTDNQSLVVMISGPLSKIDEINDTFLGIIAGTSSSEADPGPRPYGILWEHISTGADGDQAFIDPRALATDGHILYVDDFLNGILAFDARTGEFLWQQRVNSEAQITALAADTNGTLYAADTGACACVYRVTRDNAQVVASGFSSDAPRSLAARADGTLFATDIDANGSVKVRVFAAQGEQDSLFFETPLQTQPVLLTALDQNLYAITEANEWLKQDGAGFSLIAPLSIPIVNERTQITVNEAGLLAAINPIESSYLFDSTGQSTLFDSSQQPLFSSPDISLAGVAFLADGTFYTLEKTATETRLVAREVRGAIPYGTGTEMLVPNRIVTWSAPQDTQHVWLVQGHANEIIDLTALPVMPDPSMIMTIQLIDEDGKALGEQTITPQPQPPLPVKLERDGLYFIVTHQLNVAAQSYQLGYSVPRLFPTASGDQTITGTLSEAIPVQRWIIDGTAGQTLTAHVSAISGTLDPSLRLVNPRGSEVEVNEDADPALGLDAALTDIRFSNNGAYILEVRATTGAGQYQLTVGIKN